MNTTLPHVRRLRACALSGLVVALALSAGTTPLSASAAAAWQDHDEQPDVVTRVYSLRPLVDEARAGGREEAGEVVVIDLNLPQAVAPMAPGGETSADSARNAVELATQLILNTIDMETWQDNGGTIGHLTYFPVNNRLVVTHTPSVQARVAELLAQLQDRRVVSAQARLIRLDEQQVAGNTRMEGGVAVWQGDPGELPSVAQARYSGFDGRTQTVSDGRQLSYVAGVTPIVAASSVGYQTTMATLNTGLTLKITPVISQDGDEATVEVSVEYVLAPDGVGAAAAPGAISLRVKPAIEGDGQLTLDVVPQVESGDTPTTLPAMTLTGLPIFHRLVAGPEVAVPDRLNVQRQALETSLRIPTGQWVLIGSLGASGDGAATEEAPIHLLLRLDSGEARQ